MWQEYGFLLYFRWLFKQVRGMQESVFKFTLIDLMSSLFYRESNIISIWNNGKGIPVVEHKVEKVYVPALIFGQLLTSSNYDDDEKKVTGKTI